MLSWFQALLPKEEKFFEHFAAHAETLVAGSEALRGLLDGGATVPQFCAKVVEEEHKADAITRDVLLAVRRTFITPFDRGDIKDLIMLMDDAIDQMQKTAKVIMLFEVKEFDQPMRDMADIIVKASKITVELVPLLNSMGKQVTKIGKLTEDITKIEEMADQLHDKGLKALYHAHENANPMGYIIGAEIYDHLEKVVDRFEDVANRINGIVLEHM